MFRQNPLLKVGLFLGFWFVLAFGVLWVPAIQYNGDIIGVLLPINIVLLAATLFLFRSHKEWSLDFQFRSTHIVQALAQGSIYFYWGYYFEGVLKFAPFIIYQLAFANILSFLISIVTRKRFIVGMSVFPIILSINLFMWAKPEYFYLQIILVVAALAGKQYIVTRPNNRHVFNPSALAMAAMAAILLVFNLHGFFNVHEIIASYLLVPNLYLFVFVVGFFSHWVGRVSCISMGAVGAMILIDLICKKLTGLPFAATAIHASHFIGITLLVTDPATSPKTKFGQLFYGGLYGAGILFSGAALSNMGEPGYYDKILIVPLINFLSPYIDSFVGRFIRRPTLADPWVSATAYGILFFLSLNYINREISRSGPYVYYDIGKVPRVNSTLSKQLVGRLHALCAGDSTLPMCETERRLPAARH